MNHQQALTLYIAAFVSELVQTGVKDVVVSPGSTLNTDCDGDGRTS